MGFADRTVVKDRLRFDNILFDEWSPQLNREEATQQLHEIGKALSSSQLADTDFVVEGTRTTEAPVKETSASPGTSGIREELPGGEIQNSSATIKTEGFGDSRPRVGQ